MKHLRSIEQFCPFPLAWVFATCARLCLGVSRSKSSQSSATHVDSSTAIETTNQQAAATEGSLAIGAGAEAFFESSTDMDTDDHSSFAGQDGVSVGAGAAAEIQSGDGIFGGSGNIHVETMDRQNLENILDFGYAALTRSAEMGRASQEAANQLSRVTNEQMAAVVSDKAEDSASKVFQTLQQNLVKAVGIGVAGMIIWRLLK